MSCNLSTVDCYTIEDAIFKLSAYAVEIKRNIDESITDFGKEDILVRIATDRLNEIDKISANLQKISKKCDCG